MVYRIPVTVMYLYTFAFALSLVSVSLLLNQQKSVGGTHCARRDSCDTEYYISFIGANKCSISNSPIKNYSYPGNSGNDA
eukprot:scaffold5150_cov133-Skeletonema_menzelii.AAC.8